MSFVKYEKDNKRKRILIFGGPNTGKTSSLITCERPCVIVTCPGEKGVKALPQEGGIISYVFESNETEKAKDVINQMEELIDKVIATKPRTLVVDGAVKLYDWYLDKVTTGAYGKGEEFKARLYGNAHALFGHFLSHFF